MNLNPCHPFEIRSKRKNALYINPHFNKRGCMTSKIQFFNVKNIKYGMWCM